jgi:hypothetical protein
MMVKPRGCCDRNGVSSSRRTPRFLQSRPMREARQAVAAMRPALRQTAVCPLISLIELKRTLVRAPDVCDYHVRSRVMESLAATEEH